MHAIAGGGACRVPGLMAAAALLAGGACARATNAVGDTVVRVLVYNIHAGRDAAGAPTLDRIAQVIGSAAADVVMLQEVDSATSRSGGVDQLAELSRLTGLHGVFGRSLDYQGGGYGIAILSRWPIMADSTIPLPTDPPQARAGGSREPRVALHATISMPSGPIEVLDTHIDASGPDTFRLQEIAHVLEFADARRASGARIILGGDLNSTPESAVQDRVRVSGWRDAWSACGGTGEGYTYPDAAPRKRIDYLYLGAGERCRSIRVLAVDASDHLPLLVELRRTRAAAGGR